MANGSPVASVPVRLGVIVLGLTVNGVADREYGHLLHVGVGVPVAQGQQVES